MSQVFTPLWSPPPHKLTLPDHPIHIWRVELEVEDEILKNLLPTLSPDEQQRAERFRFERDRRRFIVGRGTLRAMLGRYLGMNPAEVQFCYSASGKPALNLPAGDANLAFNVSHSQDLMLCAIAQHRLVGIDLEYIRPIDDVLKLSQRFFAASEHGAIQQQPAEDQLRLFFQYWTCKEALLKAVGTGIADLSRVELSISNGVVEHIRGDIQSQPLDRWWMQLFNPAWGYVGAIASQGTRDPDVLSSLLFWQWQHSLTL